MNTVGRIFQGEALGEIANPEHASILESEEVRLLGEYCILLQPVGNTYLS